MGRVDQREEAALSYEIVYTSYPNGLKEDERGFCTVAATLGIPRLLLEKLESLSGYRHAFSAPSEHNPVNFSLQIVRVQREPYFVLSRIADAGIDYSGRNNKIAHHLALSAGDVRAAKASPSALLSDPKFWFTEWKCEPRSLPEDRMPTARPTTEAHCRTWKQIFGDAGWAGLLARSVQGVFDPVTVVVPNGRATLALVSEAMELVPAKDRWRICFSTYFTRSTPGSECHWRFVLDGTEEATQLRGRRSGMLIDPLKSSRGLPDDDAFVEAARSGEMPAIDELAVNEDQPISRHPVTRSQIRRRRAGSQARRARLAATRPTYDDDYGTPPPAPPPEAPPGNRMRVWWILAAGILVTFLISLVIIWVFSPD